MEEQRGIDIAKRVLQWRWLIIDEISMISAQLLAEVDWKLRRLMKEIDSTKKNPSGLDRPGPRRQLRHRDVRPRR